MPSALIPLSRGTFVAGLVVAAGLYAVRDTDQGKQPARKRAAAAEAGPAPSLPRPMPTLSQEAPEDLEVEEIDDQDDIEEVRGHAPIDDIEEFAMVFQVDGTSYLRLSSEVRAESRGRSRFIAADGYYAVVAPVAASQMPGEFSKWNGRSVLVDGTCEARVVGFAEVSRVTGDPPGTDDYWYGADYDDDYVRPEKEPEWTAETVVEDNVTLAAKLDSHCAGGSWARSTAHGPALVARGVEASALETAAIADLVKKDDDYDPVQEEWQEMGGDGDWRDAVEHIEATTYEHPATGEKWIFVQAYRPGGCGDAEVSEMAVYRVGKRGNVYRFADLDHAGSAIEEVVDLDGDGQPELLLGEGLTTELVDLKSTLHDSISIPVHHYGCGC